MSTIELAPTPAARRVPPFGAVNAEWIKFFGVRSNTATLPLVALAMFAMALATAAALSTREPDGSREALLPADMLSSTTWIQLAVIVIAITFIASEYSTGAARTTFLAVPTRVPVVLGKGVVIAIAAGAAGVLGAAMSLIAGAGIASSNDVWYDLPPELAAQLIIGAGLYLGTIGVLALGLGTIIRNVVGGILTTVGLLQVAPLLLGIVPIDWIRNAAAYLPTPAGQLILGPDNPAAVLSPWGGYLVLLAWAVAAIAAAATALTIRDI